MIWSIITLIGTIMSFIFFGWNFVFLVIELLNGFDSVNSWRVALVLVGLLGFLVFRFLLQESVD